MRRGGNTAIVGLRYSGRESMRVSAAIAVCLLLVVPVLRGQSALEELSKERAGTLVLVDETVDVPPDDFRRVRLPRVRAGAVLWVKFRTAPEAAQASRSSGADVPAAKDGTGGQAASDRTGRENSDGESGGIQVEILRRNDAKPGKVSYRQMQPALIGEQGELQFQIPDEGEYVVAVRQAGAPRDTAHVSLHVEVRGRGGVLAPKAQTLSRERRIAVAVFSLGFLWTALMVCGVPIIRAFRSRRTPPSPPWYA